MRATAGSAANSSTTATRMSLPTFRRCGTATWSANSGESRGPGGKRKMKHRWLIPVAVLLPLSMHALDDAVKARVATITIHADEVTPLHLRPEFESVIHMPEAVTSVVLGSPGLFQAEHNEGEPDYVYVKPITQGPAQSNLLIATKSGEHVTLELISDGSADAGSAQPIDFLIEYRASRGFLISSDRGVFSMAKEPDGEGNSASA